MPGLVMLSQPRVGQVGLGWFPAQQVMRRLEALLSSWTGDRVSESSLMVGANTSGKRAPIVWICQSNREFVTLAKSVGALISRFMVLGHLTSWWSLMS